MVKESGAVVGDDIVHAADAVGEDADAGGHGLKSDQGEAFLVFAANTDQIQAGKKLRDIVAETEDGQVPAEKVAFLSPGPDIGPRWPVADDEEMDIAEPADNLLGGLNEDIVAFTGPEIGDHGDSGDIFIGQAKDGAGPVPPLAAELIERNPIGNHGDFSLRDFIPPGETFLVTPAQSDKFIDEGVEDAI